jgi:putative transposase
MTSTTKNPYAGHRFPPELISYTVWLYYRFPLSLRMVEEMLAFRGIEVSHETIRQWALKFGQEFANIIRRRLPRPGDKWHLDEVVLKIAGKKHYEPHRICRRPFSLSHAAMACSCSMA